MTETERDRIERWWGLITDLDRQRVREFRANEQLPGDLIESYSDIVRSAVTSKFGAESGVFEMPGALIDFLDTDDS